MVEKCCDAGAISLAYAGSHVCHGLGMKVENRPRFLGKKTMPGLLFKCFGFILIVFPTSFVAAQDETVQVDVILKSIDPTTRTIYVEHNGKVSQLDLSRRASITINGAPAKSDALTPGDEATVEYHKELAVVMKIDAKGIVEQTWQFFDVFAKEVKPEQAYIV